MIDKDAQRLCYCNVGQTRLARETESTRCVKETACRKVTEANGDMKRLAGGLRWDTFGSYASIGDNADQSLLTASSRLKKMFNPKAKTLQQGVHNALCKATGGVRKSYVNAFKVVDRSLSLIVGYPKNDELVRLRS